jgi:riboflavin synthase
MFTGIIEVIGTIDSVEYKGSNATFRIQSSISTQLKVDQSVAHSGVCLTVEEVNADMHRVTAIEETIKKTNIGQWKKGGLVNLERCMKMDGRLDGHIVQGHVDTVGVCIAKTDRNGSWEFKFSYPPAFANLVIEKGSISINGTSLTVFNVGNTEFTVAIIPYTFHHTNFKNILPGDEVNLEFDIIGKYVNRIQSLSQQAI